MLRQRQGIAKVLRRAYGGNVVIVDAVRTPVGSFQGSLAGVSATELGSQTIRALVERTGIKKDDIGEVYMGNVIATGLGQAPCRQAVLNAGLPNTIPCTTINKVCASGMKAVMLASLTLQQDPSKVMIAGGMESMSNVPFIVPKVRAGLKFGDGQLIDGLLYDGLTDSYDKHPMGVCGDHCAKEHNISREEQDEYAIRSYRLANEAAEKGEFKDEIVPVSIKARKGESVVDQDEEYTRMSLEKIPRLRPAFSKEGTVTAANASTLNDGASCMLLMHEDEANKRGLKPLARILGFSDAATKPIDFPIAPALAIPSALKNANIASVDDVDFWEINEAFSVVALANQKLIGMDMDKLNVLGGGVSMGHPIGSSGSRIIVTLAHLLRRRGAKIGCAAICNGGGGASAIVIENLS